MLTINLSSKLAVLTMVLAVALASASGQQKPASSSSPGASPGASSSASSGASSALREFPVTMQQNVTAGKTPPGTKVQAKLEVATLVDGAVVPRNAVFSGEVVESVAKSKTEPSRMAIRMDSVQWKGASAAVKIYLTAWYYPVQEQTGQDLRYGPQQSAKGSWNGQGQYPDPNSKSYKPFPGSDTDKKDSTVPDTPNATTSNHRVLMHDVESTTGADGMLTLISKRTNIKLDKLTTYVFSGDVAAPK